MVDIQALVEELLEKKLTVWVEHPDIDGFFVEIAYVGREAMQKLVEKCTKRTRGRRGGRAEEEPDRPRMLKLWSEMAIKSWKGLTLKGLQSLLPIELGKDDKPETAVECEEKNKIALLTHNLTFDDWVLEVATDPTTFMELRKESKKQVANLTP